MGHMCENRTAGELDACELYNRPCRPNIYTTNGEKRLRACQTSLLVASLTIKWTLAIKITGLSVRPR